MLLVFVAPALADFSNQFGPAEFFALMVAGLFVVLSFMTFGLTNDFLCP